jgi:hypothetical protein
MYMVYVCTVMKVEVLYVYLKQEEEQEEVIHTASYTDVTTQHARTRTE